LAREPLIREMQAADLSQVAALEASSYAFPWSETIFRDCLRAGYYCCIVEQEGACVGYAVLSAGGGEAHVLNLCVAGPWRQRGLGSRLLQRVTEYATGAGAQEIFLEVRPSNTDAIRLYRARGFAQIGVRKGYYQAADGREDAVVLRRQLPAHAQGG
jgi:[ribosomal protein S18]-alanine N-acetyltransferase